MSEPLILKIEFAKERNIGPAEFTITPEQNNFSVVHHDVLVKVRRAERPKPSIQNMGPPNNVYKTDQLLVELWADALPQRIFAFPMEKLITDDQVIQLNNHNSESKIPLFEIRMRVGRVKDEWV